MVVTGAITQALGIASSEPRAPLDFSADAVRRIAISLFGQPNKRLSTATEMRFGRQGSVSVKPERGVFRDHEAGQGGGVLDMLVHAGAALDRVEAAQLLRAEGALPQRETATQRAEREFAEAKARAERVTAAGAIWKRAGGIEGTAAEAYLRRKRRITADLSEANLRFTPTAPFYPYKPDARTFPALVAAVTNANGRFIGAHTTYLHPDGSDKANVTPNRKMAGLAGAGHVLLRSGARLVVGEGIESTLSGWDAALTALGSSDGLGAAAGLSAGGVSAFEWPPGTTGLIIAYDVDPKGAGQRGGHKLAARAHAHGLRVHLLPPPEGFNDWNTHAQATMPEAF